MMNQPNTAMLMGATTCPDCLGDYNKQGEKDCVCPPPEALVVYEIYEYIDLECPKGNGTRQAKRVIEHGRCTAGEMELIREQTVKLFPKYHINAGYPARGPKPRWEGALENWIRGQRG